MRWGKELRCIRRGQFYSLLVLIYLGVIFMGGCADRLLLFPSTQPLSAVGCKATNIATMGGTVELWHQVMVPGVEREFVVLGFPGNAMRAEDMIGEMSLTWQQKPAELWTVNYPGFGKSQGKARLASIPGAALAAYDAVAARYPGQRIYLEGISIGTTAALYVAAHRPCAGVVLVNPPPLAQLIRGHYGWWNLWLAALPISWQIPGELDSLSNGPKVKAPAIFVVGEKDTVVPPKYHQKVIDAYGGPKTVIRLAEADHNDAPTAGEEIQISIVICELTHALPVTRY